MKKRYFKFDSIRRGLQYYLVSGIKQTYDRDLVWFSVKSRAHNSFMYISAQKVEFEFGSQKFEFERGNLIYVPKYSGYKITISGIDVSDFAVMQTFFNIKDEADNDYVFSDYPEKLLDVTPKHIIENMHRVAHATFNTIHPSFTILKNFFSILEYISEIEAHKNLSQTNNKKIVPALAYIALNLSEPLSIPELAKLCSMSETSFRSSFKKSTGMSPCDYKNSMKIQKCMEIIANDPGASVSSITEQVGFNDESYFYKVFFKYAKITYKDFKSRYQ